MLVNRKLPHALATLLEWAPTILSMGDINGDYQLLDSAAKTLRLVRQLLDHVLLSNRTKFQTRTRTHDITNDIDSHDELDSRTLSTDFGYQVFAALIARAIEPDIQ